MDRRERQRFEKLLFAMLASRPDAFGLVLQEGSWIPFKELHHTILAEPGFGHVRRTTLKQFLALYRPDGFEWDESRLRVRPELQKADLTSYPPSYPPERLYVAIRPSSHVYVRTHGLQPRGGRDRVILATSTEMALRIGRRKDRESVTVTVAARQAWDQGTGFERAGEELYLAEAVPAECLVLPLLHRDPRKVWRASKEEAAREAEEEVSGEKAQALALRDIGAFIPHPSDISGLAPTESGPGKRRARRKRRGAPEWKEARHRTRKR